MTWEEDVFCGIVDYWIESTYSQSRFLENLKDALFHLRLISRDEGIFEAYKEGCGIVNNRAVEKYPKLHADIPPVSPVRIFAGGSPCGLKLFTRMVL